MKSIIFCGLVKEKDDYHLLSDVVLSVVGEVSDQVQDLACGKPASMGVPFWLIFPVEKRGLERGVGLLTAVGQGHAALYFRVLECLGSPDRTAVIEPDGNAPRNFVITDINGLYATHLRGVLG
jgi:hypothetical protein